MILGKWAILAILLGIALLFCKSLYLPSVNIKDKYECKKRSLKTNLDQPSIRHESPLQILFVLFSEF